MNKLLCVIGALVMLQGCVQPRTVQPGYEGVIFRAPIFFGKGGVDSRTVKPGTEWFAWSTSIIDVPVVPSPHEEPFEDLMCKGNIPLDFHAVARLRVTQPSVLIDKFGPKWYDANIRRQFQNFIRDRAKEYTMTELSVEQSKVRAFEQEVEADLIAYLKRIGMPVEMMDVTVGKVSPPKEVLDRFAATAAETQRQNTEAQRKLAEDSRAAAEGSRAKADRAYMDQMGMSPSSWVQLESIRLCASRPGCQVFLGAAPTPIVSQK